MASKRLTKGVPVEDNVWRKLWDLKLDGNYESLNDVIKKLLQEKGLL